ncbi:unnamed protein product [Fraxinus pennsylvanica]|uniref:Uncharacterized protein n=1 Tax=Fraxinus pennsylvanica TaxID=56036 RepID=A0AAD2ACA0_9LAMI|nr:unnamed protein product [Fraxinus pennsylvanica]
MQLHLSNFNNPINAPSAHADAKYLLTTQPLRSPLSKRLRTTLKPFFASIELSPGSTALSTTSSFLIGLYHHKEHNLQALEVHKLWYLHYFLDQRKDSIERGHSESGHEDNDDGPIFTVYWMKVQVFRDLMLLENLLPHFVLSELFEMRNCGSEVLDQMQGVKDLEEAGITLKKWEKFIQNLVLWMQKPERILNSFVRCESQILGRLYIVHGSTYITQKQMVIANLLGDNSRVADLFNELGDGVITSSNSYYWEVCKEWLLDDGVMLDEVLELSSTAAMKSNYALQQLWFPRLSNLHFH